MSLASLYNVPVNDYGMKQFSFVNANYHVLQNRAILLKYNISLTDYVLDPINEQQIDTFLQRHQDIHNQVNTLLGIVGNDLSSVDFKKPDVLRSWIWLHANEHVQAAKLLGIS